MEIDIELGKQIYPQKPQRVRGIMLTFYLVLIIMNIALAIRNISIESWLWASSQIFFAVLFVIFALFLEFGKLTVYERGFGLSQSLYNEKVKGKPTYLRIQDIIAIVPEYEIINKYLKIKYFKFYYTKNKFFTLPHKEINKYIEAVRTTFYNEWPVLYNENYDIETIEWDRVEQKLKMSENKVIGYSFGLGFAVFGGAMVTMAISFGADIIFNKPLSTFMMLFCSLQIGLSVGRMMLEKDRELILTLRKYIKTYNISAVPGQISILEEFKKWLEDYEKYKIDYIEDFEGWQYRMRATHVITKESVVRESKLAQSDMPIKF